MLNNPKASEKMKKEVESKLEEPDIPDGRELVWIIFWELFSSERTSYTEIFSYLQLNRLTLSDYELELLRIMDSVACGLVADIRYPDRHKNK